MLLAAHRPGADGLCCLCRPAELDPCPARRLAVTGLGVACGETAAPVGLDWLDSVRHRLAAGELDPVDAPAEAMWSALQGRGR
jgi:hypothetical protein